MDVLTQITDALHGIPKEDLTVAEKKIARILIVQGYAEFSNPGDGEVFRRKA